jgi:hypothetical protein
MEAVQEELGTDPSGASASTVAARFTAIETDYLTASAASAAYLTQASAASTYLTQVNASATYVNRAVVTTAGDLIVATGSASVTRLGKGTEGYVLTSSSAGAQGLIWAEASGGATVEMSPTEPVSPDNGTLWVDTDSDVPTFTASAYVANSIMDAKGDILAATADNTPARLGVGTNDTVLVADSAQSTGIKWASLKASQIPTLVQNAQTDSYTLVLGDAGKLIEMGKATAQTLTIPLDSSVPFPTGTKIDVIQTGAGETTIAATGGVTVNSEGSKLKINAQWQAVALIKRATDTWVLIGAIKA